MKLQKIISQRNYNSAAPFKIVYEWENIISDKGNINLKVSHNFPYDRASCNQVLTMANVLFLMDNF